MVLTENDWKWADVLSDAIMKADSRCEDVVWS
jgi:hypothetical protein